MRLAIRIGMLGWMLGVIGSLSTNAADVEWTIKPDPIADKSFIDWAVKGDLKVVLPKSFFDPDVVFASSGGLFVSAGRNGKNESRGFFDLRTGKKYAEIKGELQIDKPVSLSSDGKLFAAKARGLRGETVAILDTKTGKVLHEWKVKKTPDQLYFVGLDKLLAYNSWGSEAEIFDVKSGESLATPTFTKEHHRSLPAISMGGKYIAQGDSKGLHLFDVATAKQLTTLENPKDKKGGNTNCLGVAFSPDGKQIAGVYEAWGEYQIALFSLEDGKQISNAAIDKPKNWAFNGDRLQWSLDGSGLFVYNEMIVDPTSGAVLWRVPDQQFNQQPRRVLSVDAVAYVDATDRNNRTLKLNTFPKDKLLAAKKILQSGGSAIDALLPPIKEVDLAAIKGIDLPLPGVEWKVQVDAAATSAKLLRYPIPLTCKGSEIESLRVSKGDKPKAIIELASRGHFGKADDATPRKLERIDLSTGKVNSKMDLPVGCALAGISHDGSLALSIDSVDRQRLDIWSLETGKHVSGLRPFSKSEQVKKISLTALIGTDKVLAVSEAGKIALFTIQDAKPIYTAEALGFQPQTLSANGKYLLGIQGMVLRVIDVATGNVAGDTEIGFQVDAPTKDRNLTSLSIRDDGQEAVAYLTKQNMPMLIRWNLATGKREESLPFRASFAAPKLQYAGSDYLLIDDRDLYDFKRKEFVWTYYFNNMEGRIASERPDQRLWYTQGTFQQPAALVAVDLPEADVLTSIQAIAEGPNAILKPGTTVSLQLNLEGGMATKVTNKVKESFQAMLQKRGMKVADSGDVVVQVSAKERDTNETIEFRKMFSSFKESPFATKSVKVIEIDCTATVLVQGQKLWQSKADKLTMGMMFGIITLPEGTKDVGEYLHTRLWEQLPNWIERAAIPRYLAKTNEGVLALPGSSQLTPTGVKTNSPVVKTK